MCTCTHVPIYDVHPQYMQICIMRKWHHMKICILSHIYQLPFRDMDMQTRRHRNIWRLQRYTIWLYDCIYTYIVRHRNWQIASCDTKTFNTLRCGTFDVVSMEMVERERLAQSIADEWFQTVRSFPTTSKYCMFFFLLCQVSLSHSKHHLKSSNIINMIKHDKHHQHHKNHQNDKDELTSSNLCWVKCFYPIIFSMILSAHRLNARKRPSEPLVFHLVRDPGGPVFVYRGCSNHGRVTVGTRTHPA